MVDRIPSLEEMIRPGVFQGSHHLQSTYGKNLSKQVRGRLLNLLSNAFSYRSRIWGMIDVADKNLGLLAVFVAW